MLVIVEFAKCWQTVTYEVSVLDGPGYSTLALFSKPQRAGVDEDARGVRRPRGSCSRLPLVSFKWKVRHRSSQGPALVTSSALSGSRIVWLIERLAADFLLTRRCSSK